MVEATLDSAELHPGIGGRVCGLSMSSSDKPG